MDLYNYLVISYMTHSIQSFMIRYTKTMDESMMVSFKAIPREFLFGLKLVIGCECGATFSPKFSPK